jgi:hypothetical protein
MDAVDTGVLFESREVLAASDALAAFLCPACEHMHPWSAERMFLLPTRDSTS